VSPLPYEAENLVVPASYDVRSINGTVFAPKITNQFVPRPCGSCWAHGSLSALASRAMLATKAQAPQIAFSTQVLLNCESSETGGSCDGGDPALAYQFIKKNGITDDTCLAYEGIDFSSWGELDCSEMMCRDCDRFGSCGFVNATRYFVEEFGTLKGEDQMKAEIFQRGPIACALWAHSASFEDYTGGIITDETKYPGITHIVSIIGWGEEHDSKGNLIPVWYGQNSFGTRWGEKGFFRLVRGKNALNLESTVCAWATLTQKSIQDIMA